MGKSVTPKYRMVIDGRMMAWSGKPTQNKLEDYVFKYADSLKLGGCNDHISLSIGYVPYPVNARIETNEMHPRTIVSWKAATFQVY